MIQNAKIILLILCVFNLIGCEKGETLAEVEFEQARLGLEYVPDRSLEGYNEKYHPFFQPSGSSQRKYLFSPDDGFQFSFFPKNSSLLGGVDVVTIDTVARSVEKYDPTVALTTLYVNPKTVDKASWETLKKFVSGSYSHPDSDNELLGWLNYGYNVGGSDTLHFLNTIYALVYSDMAALEPQYKSADGKKFLKVGVDEGIYFKEDGEQSQAWMFTGHLKDSVFYYWTGRKELLSGFGEYERDGNKFRQLYKETREEN